MATFKITLAYDGTDYVGWQRQPTGVSIQGLIEDALEALDGRPVAVAGAGRTDAGVHAFGQVASFSLERDIDAATLVRALNGHLPPDIRVRAAAAAAPAFHARFDATSKTYRYRIWNGEIVNPFERRYVWQVVGALDVDAMARGAALLEGRHDFAAFQSSGSDASTTIRTLFTSNCGSRIADCGLSADTQSPNESTIHNPQSAILITYEVCGDGFLRHMVRAIVGSLVDIGRGRHRPEWLLDVLTSERRASAGQSAPPHGLCLVSVGYSSET